MYYRNSHVKQQICELMCKIVYAINTFSLAIYLVHSLPAVSSIYGTNRFGYSLVCILVVTVYGLNEEKSPALILNAVTHNSITDSQPKNRHVTLNILNILTVALLKYVLSEFLLRLNDRRVYDVGHPIGSLQAPTNQMLSTSSKS